MEVSCGFFNNKRGCWWQNTRCTISIFSMVIQTEDLEFLKKVDVLDSLEVIGEEGCAEVYKAEIPSNPGKIMAIKKIMVGSADDSNSLKNYSLEAMRSDISTFGRIMHRNVVSLLAHVARPDCDLLIYEFAKNESLADAIRKASEGRQVLDWVTRRKIAIGIASGLEYLHFHLRSEIIHCELRPANILLDDDMEARITTNFGLAVEDEEFDASEVAKNEYMAPELLQMENMTTKCDIYSFGLILAILVVARFPSDDFFRVNYYGTNLVTWLRNIMNSANPRIAIDPRLRRNAPNGYVKQMLLVLKIAGSCVADDPDRRPNIIDVQRMLSELEH